MSSCDVTCQVSWCLRLERVQRRFVRFALRHLPWRDPLNLPPYPARCQLLGIDTLERRRRIQQAVFIAKLINGQIDSPELRSMINFRVPSRALRYTTLLELPFHWTVYGYNEPVTACLRTFSLVEDAFEFDESTSRFVNRTKRCALFRSLYENDCILVNF